MTDHSFTDEELSAVLDGVASDEVLRRLASARAAGVPVDAELDALRAASDLMRGGFEDLLDQAPPLPVLPVAAPQRRVVPFGAGLAAGVAAAALVWGGWSYSQPPKWEQYVAAYQALYVPETVAGDGLGAQAARAQIAALQDRLGIDLDALPDLDGLNLRRAQLLGFGDKPLLQIAYADETGQPVALCILPRDAGAEGPQMRQLEGLNAVAWSTDSHGFLLIGGGANTLERAAEQVRAAL